MDYEKRMEIIVQRDGVYLCIKSNMDDQAVSRKDVLSLIELYGVKDVDFVALNEVLKSDLTNIEVKISNNTEIIQKSETVEVAIDKDRMEASITFSPPLNNEKLLTEEEIQAIVEAAGIVDIIPGIIKALVVHKQYGKTYVIARGTPPIAGTDGFLQYHFNNANLRPKPKILDDGTVDFRQLGMLRLCNLGDILVTSVPPKDGTDGRDVLGKVIPFTKGRLPQALPAGKNTKISEDGLCLLAEVSGQLLIQNGKINIANCLEIKENVDNSTGNIEFNGMVIVRGNVITGFTVKAAGNIEVHGVCEGAKLISDANIILGNGAQGMDKAELTAAGDITARFIESCTVNAGGNVQADSIIKSVVNCNGEIILAGKNGLFVNGRAVAGNKLTAKTIGSPMGTTTLIEVGNNPQALMRHKELTDTYNNLKKDFEKVDQAVGTLSALQKKGQLNDDKKAVLIKMINAKIMYRERMSEVQLQIDEITLVLTSNNGTVSASKVIRPGVKVTIGNAQLTVQDDIQNCTLRNNGTKITIGSYM